MAKSKKPRKPYHRPDYSAEAARLREESAPKEVPIDKDPPAPAHPHVSHPSAPRASRGRGRYLVPVAAGAGVIGGGAFLAHRARRRKATMAKALVNPLTGDGVSFQKRYLDDDVDAAAENPRGVLVAKAGIPKRAALLMRAGQGATVAGRGARAAGRGARTAARQPGEFMGGFLDTGLEGRVARSRDALRDGKMGTARRTGAVAQAAGVGTLGIYGLGHANGSLSEKEKQSAKRRAQRAKARQANTSKRYDETALEHTGSRRVGGRLAVSSVRTAGLPVQSATFSRGNPEARPGTRSHANKLTHVHTNVKGARTGKLYVLHRRPRSKSGSTVGKSAGYAQSGGHGRRITSI